MAVKAPEGLLGQSRILRLDASQQRLCLVSRADASEMDSGGEGSKRLERTARPVMGKGRPGTM